MKKALQIILAVTVLCAFAAETKASVIYTPMNITASQTSTWNWFSFGIDANGFGLWVNPGAALRLETYLGPVIGTDDGGKVYLTSLVYGTEIGPSSTWLTPATASYINDATHSTLNGNTVYVGVQLADADGAVYYGWMQLAVSADGLSVTLMGMAYQDVAGTSLLAGAIDRQVYYEKEEVMEDLVSNDGTMGTTIPVNLVGVDFSVASGRLTANTQFTAANVPDGLFLEINVIDNKHAVISFSGRAVSHVESDSRSDLTVNFLDAAFTGATASQIIDSGKENLVIKFFDPYKVVYEELTGAVCGISGWAPFENPQYSIAMGLWHDGTDMRIETYGLSVIGTQSLGKSLITPLNEGSIIDSTSAWVTTGAWPNEPYINNSLYSTWNGKHKYAGIQVVVGNAVLYGWLNLEVSADGTTMTLYDWAFNTQPKAAIIAGQKTSGSSLTGLEPENFRVFPNPFKNQLLISFSQPLTEPTNVEILDITGKMVYQEILNSTGIISHNVDLDKLNSGIYLLKISSRSLMRTGKIVKE